MAWTQLTDLLGTARSLAVGFSIDTIGYVGLGTLSTGAKTNDFWAYNSANNTWSQKANFPGAGRYGAVGFAISTKGYVGLGADSFTSYKDFYEYNPTTNAWSRKTDWPLEGVRFAVGFGIGTIGHVGLGLTPNGLIRSDFFAFDPAGPGSWFTIATFTGGVGRYASVSFVIGTKGYVGLGATSSGQTASFYEYNPSTNTWAAKDNFGGGTRSFAIAFATSANKGYVGLGYGDTAPAGYKTDLWSFDPTLGSGSQWVKVDAFIGSARDMAVGFGIGANGYVGTGSAGGILLKDFYKFDPTSMASVRQMLSVKWHILKASAPKSTVLKWDILNKFPVSDTLILKWNIVNYVYTPNIDCVLKWHVFKEAQKSLVLSWNITDKTPVSKDRILKWDIRNYIADDTLVCKWDIEDKTPVSEDCTLKWDIYGGVQRSINFKWDIGGLIDIQDKLLICKWEIGAYIQKDLIAVWDIGDFSDVYPILILKWDIADFASSPSQTLQLRWDVGESIEKSLVCKWDIFDVVGATAFISDSLVLQWNINGRADITPKTVVLKWNISSNSISKDYIFKWDIESGVKKRLVLKWDINSEGKHKYEFESEERNKVFGREVIRRKQLITTN